MNTDRTLIIIPTYNERDNIPILVPQVCVAVPDAGILGWLAEQGHLGVGKLDTLDATALGKMLQFGAVAAGLNCAHLGCHPPTLAEVRAVLGA